MQGLKQVPNDKEYLQDSPEDPEAAHGATETTTLLKGLDLQRKDSAPGLISRMMTSTGASQMRRVIFHHKSQHVTDATTYDAEYLLLWHSMKPRAYSVFNRKSLWFSAAKLGMLSLVISVFCAFLIPDPAAVDVEVFEKVRKFLGVFVGLLLGFFMSASVARWWKCAESFLDLFSSIKVLQIDMNALGVPKADMIEILRYGVVSTWLLSLELYDKALPEEKQKAASKQTWKNIKNGVDMDDTFGRLTPEELQIMRNTNDPPANLWVWIGLYLGRLSDEGIIPPMGSPIYTRFLNSSQRSFDCIRDIRSCVTLQAPFVYVHMLAYLVHVNNLANAISFGIVCGASAGTMLSYAGLNPLYPHSTATRHEAVADAQSCLVSFVFSCFGPFVYQSLLECSMAISQPFGNEDAVVPTRRFIKALEKDLHDGFMLAEAVAWKQPRFKK